METYQSRNVGFFGLHTLGAWRVKMYTISHQARFAAVGAFQSALERLPTMLQEAEAGPWPTYGQAFVIVHEGRDGVWALYYWWTGGEMLESRLYFAPHTEPTQWRPYPRPGGLVCVWELEVIIHERQAWIDHVLRRAKAPDFAAYTECVMPAAISHENQARL